MSASWFILYSNGKEWSDAPLYVGEEYQWTINPDARTGDFGLLYATAPVKAFVAVVRVLEDATPSEDAIYHANNEGWACIEVIEEVFDPPEYRDFSENQALTNTWTLVKSQMQPSKGPEKIPFTAVQMLAEYIPELDDLLHNPDNEHRCGRRKFYRVLAPNGQPLKKDVTFETHEAAKRYINQPAAKGYGLWIKEVIE
jgi:hypothetical protein